MKTQIFLSYKKFNILNWRTYLAPFIRLTTYFKGKGLHGLATKFHHCGVVITNPKTNHTFVIEALAEGVVIRTLKDIERDYDIIEYLDINFDYNQHGFWQWCFAQVGKKYDFSGVMFHKLIFQIFGIWLRKKESKRVDCTFFAKGFYLFARVNEDFKSYESFDPQDFVRLWQGKKMFQRS